MIKKLKNNSSCAHPTLIIILLCLISSTGRFVIDSYLPSLPSIQYELALNDTLAQLTLSIYLLGFGASQLIYGPLSDSFGRRKVLLLGMLIFLMGNIACANTDSGAGLLLARLIAGIGAGACGVLNRVIASDYFSGAAFAKAWSYTTTALVLTLIFAPLIGGYIQTWQGWSGNFTACSLFIGAVLLITFILLPETNLHIGKHSHGFKSTSRYYWTGLTSMTFMVPTFAYMLAFSGLIAYFQVSPLLLVENYNWTPIQYGWSSLAIALSYLVGGSMVHRWVHAVGISRMLKSGLLLSLLGGMLLLLSIKFFPHTGWLVVACSSIYVLGARLVIPNASALAMNYATIPKGCASALVGAMQMLGSMFLGILIAQFTVNSAMPLAVFFVGVSSVALLLYGLWHR